MHVVSMALSKIQTEGTYCDADGSEGGICV